MIKPSFWETETYLKKADYVIIGSGIVGLSTAINIKERVPKSRVVIIERGSLPSGASTRNAGFACFGSLSELISDLEHQSEEEVFSLIEKRWRGLQRLRERVGDKNLDYQEWGGYELFDKTETAIYDSCVERMSYFNEKLSVLTGHAQVYQLAPEKLKQFKFGNIQELIWNSCEGQIHTGKMMVMLEKIARAKGVVILNGVEVNGYESGTDEVIIYGEEGFEMRAGKLGMCTNGFLNKFVPELRVIPARNQVLITKPIPNLAVKGTFHYNEGYVYFRNVGDRILLGGFRNLAEEDETTDEFGLSAYIQESLVEFLKTVVIPNREVEIEQWWSGIMGLGKTKAPIVEELGTRVYAGVRLGGMGVAIGSLVGEELAELMIK